jgi:hypothetical protein
MWNNKIPEHEDERAGREMLKAQLERETFCRKIWEVNVEVL